MQAFDHVRLVEVVADEAEPALAVEMLAVVGDDAGGFLAAVLQGVQAERGELGCVRMAEDAEDAAFLPQPIIAVPGVFRHLIADFAASILSGVERHASLQRKRAQANA